MLSNSCKQHNQLNAASAEQNQHWTWAFLHHITKPKSKRKDGSPMISEEPGGCSKASIMLELTSYHLLTVLHEEPLEKSLHSFWVSQLAIAPHSEK